MLSTNFLAQFLQDPNGDLTYLDQLKPGAVVVMDSMGYATTIKGQLPQCLVIHRTYHPDDAEFHLKWTPQQFADAYLVNVPSGMIVQCLNEPSGYANYEQLGQWCRSVMQIASGRGIRLCLPNFGMGHPTEDVALLDSLWRAFRDYPEHILGLHEYFNNDPLNEPYHVGRFKAIVTRFQQLGIPMPKIAITEAGRDIGGGHDGWRTVYDEATYATKLEQQASVYLGTAVVAMTVFCMGKGGGNRWETYDYETAGTVKQRTIDWNKEHPVTQPNYGQRIDSATVILVNATAVNIRPAPNTNGSPVGQLLGGEIIPYYQNPVNGWWQIEWQGQLRYTSSTYVQFDAGNAQEQWLQELRTHNDVMSDLLDHPPA